MVNQAAIERYGYSREEFLSMTLGDIRPQEDMSSSRDFKTASEKRRLAAKWRIGKRRIANLRICTLTRLSWKDKWSGWWSTKISPKVFGREAELKRVKLKPERFCQQCRTLCFRSVDGTYLGFYANRSSDLFCHRKNLWAGRLQRSCPLILLSWPCIHIARALDSGAPQVFEYVLPMSDGVGHFEARMVTSGRDEVLTIVRDISDRRQAAAEREKLILELQEAVANIKALRGLLPICAYCKKIRDDQGYWNQVELYIRRHAEVQFTHGVCPDCARRIVPDVNLE